eukprot:jgi/Orpsp1_1/1187558/evm.model.d7180000058567.1
MVFETLELEILQNRDCTHMFYPSDIDIKSINWYVHTGLTEDLINYSYAVNDNDSDNNNIVGQIKEESPLLKYNKTLNIGKGNKLDFKDYNKEKKRNVNNCRFSFQKYNKNIHFNGIPRVDYNEKTNNSFLWQKIPDIINDENGYFGKFNLSKSAFKQSGFILKVVFEGHYSTSIYNDYYNLIINKKREPFFNLFGHGNHSNTINFYNPKYRLFNFNCNLIPEIDVDLKLMNLYKTIKNYEENSINESNNNNLNNKNNDKSNFNLIYGEDFLFKNNGTQNLLINIRNDKCYNRLSYLRNNSNIKKGCEIIGKYTDYFKMLNVSTTILNSDSNITNIKEIDLKNVDHISFYKILYYCYKGYFPDQYVYNLYDWFALLSISTKFSFHSITSYSEYQIKKYMTLDTINEINEYAI